MKKYLIPILISLFAVPTLAAPVLRYDRTILPETTNTYDLGTTTKVWRNINANRICLSGDCQIAWPTGGSGVSNFYQLSDVNLTGTSTGDILYWNGTDWVNLGVGATDKVLKVSGGVPTWQDDATGAPGGGITTLNGLTTDPQSFATSSDTNIGLKITSSGSTHTFTPLWIGTLADSRITSASNWNTAFGWGNHASAGYLLSSNFNNLFDTRFDGTTTDALSEGVTNLYWTPVRFNNAFDTRLDATTTDALTEGSNNLYWTDNRFDTRLFSTSTLPNLGVLSGLYSVGSSTGITTILGKTVMANASTSNLTVTGDTYLSGISAPTFLALNNQNKIIATTTPSGGSGTVNSGTQYQTAYYATNGTAVSGTSTITIKDHKVGIATTTPNEALTVVGNINQLGGYAHFGTVYSPASCITSNSCLEMYGNESTNLGSYIQAGNINSGTAAYTGLALNNNLADNSFLHYGGIFYNSSNYSDTSFGTANAVPNLLNVQNTDGPINLTAGTSTSAGYVTIVTGGQATTSERVRITSTGDVGIASTTPAAKLALGSGSILCPNYLITSTSTSQAIDFRNGCSQTFRAGTSAVTMTFTYFTPGAKGEITYCAPGYAQAGALTLSGVVWAIDGATPVIAPTAGKCMTFLAEGYYNSTTTAVRIMGTSTPAH